MTSQIIMPNESKMNMKDLDYFQKQLLKFTNIEFARKNVLFFSELLGKIEGYLFVAEQKNLENYFNHFIVLDFINIYISILNLQIKDLSYSILKTLYFFHTNIQNKILTYYIYSKKIINYVINLFFDDDEFLSLQVNFMKSLSLKINDENLVFFYEPNFNYFPLLSKAFSLYDNKDSMIRNVVKNIFLALIKIKDNNLTNYLTNFPICVYFPNIIFQIKNIMIKLSTIDFSKLNHKITIEINNSFDNLIDLLLYLSDLFDLNLDNINFILINCMINEIILPLSNRILDYNNIINNQINYQFCLYFFTLFIFQIKNEFVQDLICYILFSDKIDKEFLDIIKNYKHFDYVDNDVIKSINNMLKNCENTDINDNDWKNISQYLKQKTEVDLSTGVYNKNAIYFKICHFIKNNNENYCDNEILMNIKEIFEDLNEEGVLDNNILINCVYDLYYKKIQNKSKEKSNNNNIDNNDNKNNFVHKDLLGINDILNSKTNDDNINNNDNIHNVDNTNNNDNTHHDDNTNNNNSTHHDYNINNNYNSTHHDDNTNNLLNNINENDENQQNFIYEEEKNIIKASQNKIVKMNEFLYNPILNSSFFTNLIFEEKKFTLFNIFYNEITNSQIKYRKITNDLIFSNIKYLLEYMNNFSINGKEYINKIIFPKLCFSINQVYKEIEQMLNSNTFLQNLAFEYTKTTYDIYCKNIVKKVNDLLTLPYLIIPPKYAQNLNNYPENLKLEKKPHEIFTNFLFNFFNLYDLIVENSNKETIIKSIKNNGFPLSNESLKLFLGKVYNGNEVGEDNCLCQLVKNDSSNVLSMIILGGDTFYLGEILSSDINNLSQIKIIKKIFLRRLRITKNNNSNVLLNIIEESDNPLEDNKKKPMIIHGFNPKNTEDMYNYLNQQKLMTQQFEYTLFKSYIEEIIKTVNNNNNIQ